MRALSLERVGLPPAVDYSDSDLDAVFASAFSRAVADLEERFGTDDVSEWRVAAQVQDLDDRSFYDLPIGVVDAGDIPFFERLIENIVRPGNSR